jgi:hypothetical protein
MNFKRTKLTKKNLMEFSEGVFIESNVYENKKSIYSDYVAPIDTREKQWKKIKKAQADGLSCNIYKNENDMVEFYNDLKIRSDFSKKVKRVKLLKKEFLKLPEGSYIISNVFNSPLNPVYQGRVVSLEKREQQWKELKECWVNGRAFDVLDNEDDKNQYFENSKKWYQEQIDQQNIKD